MTAKKPTDNEIIKALECCLDISPSTCKNCPLFNVTNSTMVCSKIAIKFALDLINRLQAEVDNYKQIAENQQKIILDKAFENKKLKGEIERLRAKTEKRTQEKLELGRIYTQKLKTAKAEAYKECIEKVKEKSCKLNMCHNDIVIKTDYQISGEKLDTISKELVGEDNVEEKE